MALKLLALLMLAGVCTVYVAAADAKCPPDSLVKDKPALKSSQKDCGGSFAHEYQCSGYDSLNCSFQIKTWVYVTMTIVSACLMLFSILSCLMSCFKK